MNKGLKKFEFGMQVVKAWKDKDSGEMFVEGVASDTAKDSHGERMSEAAIFRMVKQIKDRGDVILLPTHRDTFDIGKAVDSRPLSQKVLDGLFGENIGKAPGLGITFKLDGRFPEATVLFEEVQSGKSQKQLSVGGWLNPENQNATFWEKDPETGEESRVIDDLLLEHVALTRGGFAANERTGLTSAIVKCLAKEDFDYKEGASPEAIGKPIVSPGADGKCPAGFEKLPGGKCHPKKDAKKEDVDAAVAADEQAQLDALAAEAEKAGHQSVKPVGGKCPAGFKLGGDGMCQREKAEPKKDAAKDLTTGSDPVEDRIIERGAEAFCNALMKMWDKMTGGQVMKTKEALKAALGVMEGLKGLDLSKMTAEDKAELLKALSPLGEVTKALAPASEEKPPVAPTPPAPPAAEDKSESEKALIAIKDELVKAVTDIRAELQAVKSALPEQVKAHGDKVEEALKSVKEVADGLIALSAQLQALEKAALGSTAITEPKKDKTAGSDKPTKSIWKGVLLRTGGRAPAGAAAE